MATVMLRQAPVLRLKTTQAEIDKAVKRDATACVFAEAVKKAFPKATRIKATVQTLRFSLEDKRERHVYVTSKPMQRQIIHFDQGHKDQLAPAVYNLVEGFIKPMGYAANHGGQTRDWKSEYKRKKRAKARLKKLGRLKPNPFAVSKERKFGVCALEE